MPARPPARRDADLYRALVETTASDVWRASADGALLTDIPRWRHTSRQSPQEVLGNGWLAAIHPDDADRVAGVWAEAVDAGAVYDVEYRIRPVRGTVEEGDVRTLVVRGVPARDETGRVVAYLGLTLDVTDRRRESAERKALGRRVDEVVQRMLRVQRLTERLSGALDVTGIAEAVLDEARSGLGATGGGLSLLDPTGTRLQYQSLGGYDPDVKAAWSDVGTTTHSPGPVVLRTGVPLLLSGPDELLQRFPSEAMRRFVDATGERAWVRWPLRTTGPPFGVLALGWPQERDWDEEEQAFLRTLAGLAAQALERARAYERERDHAAMLQRSLLPERLPDLAGLLVRGVYRAGTAGLAVGGDWYDAFPLPDGRLALAVGDVRGKGAPAASVMGRLRAVLRAYAVLEPDPARVLQHLDAFMAAAEDPEELVTLAYAVLDLTDGSLVHVSAGHPPALVHDGSAVRALADGRGVPLGVSTSPRSAAVDVLPPGSTLVLVTDGLLDERHTSVDRALAGIADRIGSAPRSGEVLDADALADHLLAALDVSDSGDDATVLVVQRRPQDVAVRATAAELPPDPRSARLARDLVRRTCESWGLDDHEDVVLLLVSELVTNAVVHARSVAELRLEVRGDRLRVEVSDAAASLQPRRRDAGEEATNGRGLELVEALSSAWGTTAAHRGVGKTVWFELLLA